MSLLTVPAYTLSRNSRPISTIQDGFIITAAHSVPRLLSYELALHLALPVHLPTQSPHRSSSHPFSSWRVRSLIASDLTDLPPCSSPSSWVDPLPCVGRTPRIRAPMQSWDHHRLGIWLTIAGIDERGICLVCGLSARNKSLDPITLICNLHQAHPGRL
jgi:hypothetical protein